MAREASKSPHQGLRVTGHVFGQELQGNGTIEAGVLGLVNHSHSTAAQLLDNPLVRDGSANHWQACYGGSAVKSMKPGSFSGLEARRTHSVKPGAFRNMRNS